MGGLAHNGPTVGVKDGEVRHVEENMYKNVSYIYIYIYVNSSIHIYVCVYVCISACHIF